MYSTSGGSVDAAHIARRIESPRDRVWLFLVEAECRRRWWPNTQIEFWRGGRINSEFAPHANHPLWLRGEVDVLIDGHALGFVWAAEDSSQPTSVLIALESMSEATMIRVTEVGFHSMEYQSEQLNQVERMWRERFTRLQTALNPSEKDVSAVSSADAVSLDQEESPALIVRSDHVRG